MRAIAGYTPEKLLQSRRGIGRQVYLGTRASDALEVVLKHFPWTDPAAVREFEILRGRPRTQARPRAEPRLRSSERTGASFRRSRRVTMDRGLDSRSDLYSFGATLC